MSAGRVRHAVWAAGLAAALAAAGQGEPDAVRALVQAGRYPEAERRAREELADAERGKGAESLEAARAAERLVEALRYLDRSGEPEARALAERALSLRRRLLPPGHPETAVSLRWLADVLRDRGETGQAERAYREALAALEASRGPDHPELADALLGLAGTRNDAGAYAEAPPLIERALAIRERALGAGHAEVGVALNDLALAHYALGQFAKAEPLFERALGVEEAALGQDHPELALTLGNLGNLHRRAGRYPQARAAFERALAISERAFGPDHVQVARSLNNLGALFFSTGEYALGRDSLERALAIRARLGDKESTSVATTLNNLASILDNLGELAEARRHHERALAIYEAALGPEHPSVARSLNNLGFLLQNLGDYGGARARYERALAIREKTFGEAHPDVTNSLNNLGNLMWRLRDAAEARRLYERALALNERVLGPEHPDVARSLTNLAVLLSETGDLERARALHERALAIREKALGAGHASVANTLLNLGTLLRRQGQLARAAELIERAVATVEKALGPEHLETASALAGLADLRAGGDDAASVLELRERVLRIRERVLGEAHPLSAQARAALARSLLAAGRPREALQAALAAECAARDHARLTLRALSERQALALARERASGLGVALQVAAREPGAVAAFWDALLRSRGLVLDELAERRSRSAEPGPQSAEAWSELRAARQQLANLAVRGPGARPGEYRALLEGARVRRERAERELAGRSASFRTALLRDAIGLGEVRAALPGDAALVAFLRHEAPGAAGASRGYAALVLAPGAEPRLLAVGDAGDVDTRVAAWRQALLAESRAPRRGSPRGERLYRQAAERLRERLIDPIEPLLGDAARVFVVPDGSLHLVSFAALPARDGRYLAEGRRVFHYLSAEKDLVRGEPKRRGAGLLALGDPAFDALPQRTHLARAEPAQRFRGERSACGGFERLRFERLPASAREVAAIAATWSRAERGEALRLTRGEASEQRLKGALEAERSVVHLSTHGFFLDACPSAAADPAQADVAGELGENPLLLSGLALAGANRRHEAAPDDEDGILTAEEIAALDLRGVEWAVLSSCDSGIGRIEAGEGVLGLRRAFQAAGARTVIMSLWPVDDEAGRTFMTALYRRRFAEGRATAEAMQLALRDALAAQRRDGRGGHPFYWAPFIAAGDWH